MVDSGSVLGGTRTHRLLALILMAASLVPTDAARAGVPAPGTSPGSSDPAIESQPVYSGVADTTIMVPMRDGIRLAVNLLRPNVPVDGAPERRFPALIVASPYRKDIFIDSLYPVQNYFTVRGYVVVTFDVRGIGDSEGTYPYPFNPAEQRDLYDLIEWAGVQPWSNGNVGMTGQSYLGISQYLAAAQRPPHLKAIFPCKAYDDPYRDIVYHGGIFNAQFMSMWGTLTQGFWTAPPTAANLGAGDGSDPASLTQNWTEHLTQNQNVLAWARSNPTDNDLWRGMALYTKHDAIRSSGVPTYNCGGWYDGFARGTIETFSNLQGAPNQRLIMGPWSHTDYNQDDSEAPQTGFAFYFDAQFPINHEMLRWYDHWLKGMPDTFAGQPPVMYYALGENRWKYADSWPPSGTSVETLHLSGATSGSARSLNDGSLVRAAVVGDQTPDQIVTHPSGTGEAASKWENVAAAPFQKTDQRADEVHALTYSTDPLSDPLTVAGPIELPLYGDSSAIDADWIAKLADVAPDGSSKLISTGYLRASHRALDPERTLPLRPWHPHTAPSTLIPGQVYEFRIEIWPTATTFRAGHRLRLAISSMDLPNHEPVPFPAVNQVFHDGARPSALRLSVLRA